jgi:hypothetical protein
MFNETPKFLDSVACEVSLMCFRTRNTPEDEYRSFLKRSVCVICGNGDGPKMESCSIFEHHPLRQLGAGPWNRSR